MMSCFQVVAQFEKSAANAPNMTSVDISPGNFQDQKYLYAYYMDPQGPDFHPFRSTMTAVKLSYGPIFRNVHRMTTVTK